MKKVLKALSSSFLRGLTHVQFKLLGVAGGKGIGVCGGLPYIKAPRNSIRIGNEVNINSSAKANPIGLGQRTMFIVKRGGSITIGDEVGMSNCTIVSHSSVSIGKGAVIGGGVCIYDTDFHSVYAEPRLNGNTDVAARPVVIGEETFIGAGALILKGVHIGARAVVGAGAVVARDVPAGEVWAGNPARFIKKLY